MLLNPDKSLDEIIRSKTTPRPLKRLNQNIYPKFNGISTLNLRFNNIRRHSDARLKILKKLDAQEDLRNKLDVNDFAISNLEENVDDASSFLPLALSESGLDPNLNTSSFSGLPSYHETKKIQITIKGLNKPKKDSFLRCNDYKFHTFPVIREPYESEVPNVQHPQYFVQSPRRSSTHFTYGDYSRKSNFHRHASQFKDIISNTNNLVTGTKLYISNLSSSVTRRDITELCEAIGRIESVTLHQCVAEVIFVSKHSAMEAYKTYHNRHLDGKAMMCRICSSYNLNSHASVSPLFSKHSPSFRGQKFVNSLCSLNY
ncbi:polymerase delta-interacting protein 3-like [Oopsacas minuta]|uniref:Polymerase delta-interacting protein 3-like n=1 Tax=Oopsacas minuta TaxID=111878 RepID=A0AAV7JH07_9METZ|nr:polymerase delta-interacting protein 3-like [Oopsacas minuta]